MHGKFRHAFYLEKTNKKHGKPNNKIYNTLQKKVVVGPIQYLNGALTMDKRLWSSLKFCLIYPIEAKKLFCYNILQLKSKSKLKIKIHTIDARSLVLEWQTVTVAWFHVNKLAIGAPTILLRPTTTALEPCISTPGNLIKSISILCYAMTSSTFYVHSRSCGKYKTISVTCK